MYHPTTPHIIEGADIAAVHELSVEQHNNGKKYLHMVAELRPEKDYTIPHPPLDDAKRPTRDGVEHMLHVTDGVTPRVLQQQHAYPKAEAIDPHEDAASEPDEQPKEATVKGHKVRK